MATVWRLTFLTTNTLNGVDQATGMHYQTDTSVIGDEPSAATVLTQLIQHWSTSAENLLKFAGGMTPSARVTGVEVLEQVLDPNNTPHQSARRDVAVVGTDTAITGEACPQNMAVWIATKGNLAGKSHRGGFHLPGPVSVTSLDTKGKWDDRTVWNTIANTYKDALEDVFANGGDLLPVVYSPTLRARGIDFTDQVTSAIVSLTPRWLESRSS